jgi:putative PIN family toxin of toxin-antitoxin system
VNVLIDTNVLLSFLLQPRGKTAPTLIVQRILDGEFKLLLPDYVINEALEATRDKAYFVARITPNRVREPMDALAAISIQSPAMTSAVGRWTRDPNDDFLVAVALVAGVDYLVSGDKDLLELGDTLAPLKIRSPQAFIDEVEGESRPGVD